jgi:2-isopropylmalate synthase
MPFVNGLSRLRGPGIRVLDYHEHAIAAGADARAAAYTELCIGESVTLFGGGLDSNIVSASLKAIASGWRRARRHAAADTPNFRDFLTDPQLEETDPWLTS